MWRPRDNQVKREQDVRIDIERIEISASTESNLKLSLWFGKKAYHSLVNWEETGDDSKPKETNSCR